ncbi:MAG TPA: hypothetical protein DCP90_08525 [Clostridiales bacterium]|nr:MAG: hypothetical protein A2Y22_05900 [Clostridiales bacterium GWD2_32_59]HAN10638.1 hypothetical protein [Clostridiales bacterium]
MNRNKENNDSINLVFNSIQDSTNAAKGISADVAVKVQDEIQNIAEGNGISLPEYQVEEDMLVL